MLARLRRVLRNTEKTPKIPAAFIERLPTDDYPICCPKCAYSLMHLTSSRCPECATDFDRIDLIRSTYFTTDNAIICAIDCPRLHRLDAWYRRTLTIFLCGTAALFLLGFILSRLFRVEFPPRGDMDDFKNNVGSWIDIQIALRWIGLAMCLAFGVARGVLGSLRRKRINELFNEYAAMPLSAERT